MKPAPLHALAEDAGLLIEWRDFAGARKTVTDEALRRVLTAMGLAADTDPAIARSRAELAAERAEGPALVVAEGAERLYLDGSLARRGADGGIAQMIQSEGKGAVDLPWTLEKGRIGLDLPSSPGYHTLEIEGRTLALAVTPKRGFALEDRRPGGRLWGAAAQVYAMKDARRQPFGDFTALGAFAEAAASAGADALAVSPLHALFLADPSRCSPYAPSTRLFLNSLYGDPDLLFPEHVAAIGGAIGGAGSHGAVAGGGGAADPDGPDVFKEGLDLIDWPTAGRWKRGLLRSVFEAFADRADDPRQAAFLAFRRAGGEDLLQHATFEALHEALSANGAGGWPDWPAAYRDPASPAVAAFGRERSREVTFHIFAQWVADHSLSVAQGRAREAGMAVGLIADLAVGTDPGGSHAWSRRADILSGLNIGAPPDLLQKHGQDWGVAAFSPRALRSSGYQPFLATLRAGLRHAGGLRIDHVMGLLRLWMVPHGDSAADGAYLRYPVGDLLGLIALESSRAGALIVGEDLGTVPEGFREALAGKGLMGMSVLWFERDEETFSSPGTWSKAAMAMTSTHDLPTIAGWWSERDIDWQARRGAVDEVAACASPAPQTQSCDGAPPASDAALDVASDRKARALDRHRLWRAFCEAGVAAGPAPPPTDTGPVVDAAAGFIAQSPSPLALAPIEDLLGLTEQINLPGDISLHPNWRRRLPASADHLFETASLKARTARLNDRRG